MTESSDHDVVEAMKLQIAQLQERNEAIQASMETIQYHHREKEESMLDDLSDPDPQPLSAEIWNALVLENFKPPSLLSLNGKSDPKQHITTFNTRISVVGAAESLNCKLLEGTFKDVALRWYMNLLHFSIVRVPLGVPIYLRGFLVNNKTSFDYYKQDETRNSRTCCAIFFQTIYECSSWS